MATKVKRANMSTPDGGRMVQWSPGDYVALDVLDIQNSLRKPSSWLEVSVAAGASCTILINAMHRRYPIYKPAAAVGVYAPDLKNEYEFIDTNAMSYALTGGEVLILDTVAVCNVYVSALSGNVTITAR